MIKKYEKGSILGYENGNQFVVFESLEEGSNIYLLAMKLDGEIQDNIKIDYNKLVMLKVLPNDDTVLEDDENTIKEVYSKMREREITELNKYKTNN